MPLACGWYAVMVMEWQHCSKGKSSSQPAAAIQPIPVPHQRFSHLHVDLVGPLPVSVAGYSYLFTIIDRSSRRVEAVSLKTMDAASCTNALVSAWISRFGVPATITSGSPVLRVVYLYSTEASNELNNGILLSADFPPLPLADFLYIYIHTHIGCHFQLKSKAPENCLGFCYPS
jgi:hypothetical protein